MFVATGDCYPRTKPASVGDSFASGGGNGVGTAFVGNQSEFASGDCLRPCVRRASLAAICDKKCRYLGCFTGFLPFYAKKHLKWLGILIAIGRLLLSEIRSMKIENPVCGEFSRSVTPNHFGTKCSDFSTGDGTGDNAARYAIGVLIAKNHINYTNRANKKRVMEVV